MTKKLIIATALSLLGAVFLMQQTDREYINLTPTEGQEHGLVLRSANIYQQSFIARRRTITRLGLFFRPAQEGLPPGDIVIKLARGETVLAEQRLPASFIDAEGAAQIRLMPPVATTPGETLSIHLAVPPALDGALRLQQRLPDETFDASNVSLTMNRQPQENPAGYQIYHRYRPALALQIGGLLILAALFLLFHSRLIYCVGLAALFAWPAWRAGAGGTVLFIYAMLALGSCLLLLSRRGLPQLPILAGAHIFAFSTWFPLQALAGRSYYMLAGLLPLMLLMPRRIMRTTAIIALAAAVLAVLTQPGTSPAAASLRDIFLDPNQVISAQKVPNHSWDNFGSYVGIPASLLALLGLITRGRHHLPIVILAVASVLASRLYPHTSILTVLAIAYFAALGLQSLEQFLLESRGSRSVVTIVIATLVVIILLDLWQVAAATVEYNRL